MKFISKKSKTLRRKVGKHMYITYKPQLPAPKIRKA